MPRLIAFLRGINVGGHRVTMDDLRRHFEALKLREVATFIASGNVIFTTAARELGALERRIETHLEAKLGYAVPTLLRATAEVAAVAAHRPFASSELEDPTNSIHVIFCRAPVPAADEARLLSLNGPKDEFHVHGREVYWLCRGKISVDSLAAPQLEKAFRGAEGTMRNRKTVRQLAALYPPE